MFGYPDRVGRLAKFVGQSTTFPADQCFIHFTEGHLKPFLSRRERPEYIKHHRGSRLHSYQSGSAFAIGISNPDRDHKPGCHPDGPSIPKSETGSRFPGNPLGRSKLLPKQFFTRPHHFFHGLQCVVHSCRIENMCLKQSWHR